MREPAARLLLGLSVFVLGCEMKKPSELAISQEFSSGQVEVILSATEEFFEAMPETRVPVFIGDDNRKGSIVPQPSWRPKEERGKANLTPWTAPRIEVCSDCPPEKLRTVVLHELGHAFSGRSDHLGPGNIMCSNSDCVGEKLTTEDVNYVLCED